MPDAGTTQPESGSCVSQRFARLESHGATQRDLDHHQREDDRADQCHRDVQRREREQHVLVEHVLRERDDGVGESEAEWDADHPAPSAPPEPQSQPNQSTPRGDRPRRRSHPA